MSLLDPFSKSSNTSTLRGVALPQDRLATHGDEDRRQLDNEVSEEEDTPFSVYKSPCTIEVSNDLFTAAEYDEMEICGHTFYGKDCDDIVDGDSNGQLSSSPFELMIIRDDIRPLNITFDYELHYDPDANITQTLASLEATIVEHLAFATGLEECDVDIDGKRSRHRKRKLEGITFTETELATIQAVSSEPIDVQDSEWDNCAVIVEGSISRTTTCKPFNGHLTMFLQNDPTLLENEISSIRVNALRLIRSGMFNNVYVSGNVKKVVFIGRRADDGSPYFDSAQWQVEQQSKRGMSGLSKSLFSVLAVLFVAVLALLAIRSRKKKIAAGSRPVKGGHDSDAIIQDQRTVEGSDGEPSPTAVNSGGTRAVAPIPGSLAEKDELALAHPSDYDEVSSLSSASVTPMVRVKPRDRQGRVMTLLSTSGDSNDTDPAIQCFGENGINEQKSLYSDRSMLDKFDGDVIRCLNTIAEDSDDDVVILDDSDSLMLADTHDAAPNS